MQVVTNCTTKQNVKYIAKANAKNFQNISNLILKRARRLYHLALATIRMVNRHLLMLPAERMLGNFVLVLPVPAEEHRLAEALPVAPGLLVLLVLGLLLALE